MKTYSASYLKISKGEFKVKIKRAEELMKECRLCPKKCGVNRKKSEKGFCGLVGKASIAAARRHFGEEKPLVGKGGSGTVFFSSCNLKCVFCQNHRISQNNKGKELDHRKLAEKFLKLQEEGAENINLVTPTPQIPVILKAIFKGRNSGLNLPIVYNTGGYDSMEVLKLLDNIVDIYMPDVKYMEDNLAKRYSKVENYPKVVKRTTKEMYRQVGDLKINEKGVATRGLLVRHLVLPNNLKNSKRVLDFLIELSEDCFVNLMGQYRPCYKVSRKKYSEINRSVTLNEMKKIIDYAEEIGLKRLKT